MVSENQMHYTNPWVVMAWSFFFPGFGHIMLGDYLQGWVLFLWELFVNIHSHFNVAIVLALTGHFGASVKVLATGDTYWILLYGMVFCYALFGSYMLSVEINNNYTLAFAENVPVEISKINAFQINYMTKRNPWIAWAWSMFMPGLGDMYSRRLSASIFVLAWWITIVHFSGALQAIVQTFLGHFDAAVSILNPEWLLFLPSIYAFALFNSFSAVIEQNKLYDTQQANFLKSQFQSPKFPFHVSKGAQDMRVISTFEHSDYLEKAITSIEYHGISSESIFAVPLQKNHQTSVVSLDSLNKSDGQSTVDVPLLAAGFFCSLGTIYGFALPLGPVVWGLSGFFGGLLIGIVIKIILIRHSSLKVERLSSRTEVVLMIDCTAQEADLVKKILSENQAIGISVVGADPLEMTASGLNS